MANITKITILLLISLHVFTYAAESLRFYADKLGFDIGVAIKESYITGNDQAHNNVVKSEFNTLVCENQMKAANLAPSKNAYNFSIADQVVTFATNNSMKIRGHTLIWYNQNPSWLASGTKQTLLENMKYHIEKVMGHYKGKLYQWDVVNEAFADEGGGYRDSPFYSIIGEDFIDSAFTYAHKADPDCKLYLNDYNNSYVNDKSTAIYNKVKKMISNGIPIHGVGFQCHERSAKKEPDLYKKIKDNFDRFAALGLDIAITEIDIRRWDSTLAVQGEVYATFLRAALDQPKCRTFISWGVRDMDSWIGADQQALLFDNNFKPKPAYDSLFSVLKLYSETETRKNMITKREKRQGLSIYNTSNVNNVSNAKVFNLRGARTCFNSDCGNNVQINAGRSPGIFILRMDDAEAASAFVKIR